MREKDVKSYFFQLHISPFLCENIKKELHPICCFEKKGCLAKKKTAHNSS
jgi:hypothetical protein